ncbi:MAG: AgmX/PglI C-terminal domain-containing protein, partial [Deltaproteobacteria bacterium]|nr:AgmX/PglI C-terminal domain-containing protein [Deltaproteobacteria bacterium]
MIKLQLLRGSKVIRAYKIKSDTFTIGAQKGCTIRAAGDPSVLPKHATAYIEDGELVLVPEPGAEVLLNGEPVDFAVPGPSDVFKIGRLNFRVELVEATDSIVPPARKRASVPPKAKPSPQPKVPPKREVKADRPSVPPVRPSVPPPRRSAPPPAIEPDTVPIPTAELPVEAKAPEPEPAPAPVPEPEPEPIDFGPEPDENFYFSDYDDDEEGFVEPFDLREELLKPREPAREGRREPYCAAHVVRVVKGRVVETFGVLPGKPFRARNGELACWIRQGRLTLKTAGELNGEIRHGDERDELSDAELQRGGTRSVVLADGDLAVVQGVGTTEYKIEAYRPPAFMRRGGSRLGKAFFIMIGVAFALHVVVGAAVAYVQPKVDEAGEGKEEEVFAEVKVDKPEDTMTPKEMELEEAPKDATEMSEKAPAVTAKQVKKIEKKEKASSSVSSLLKILSKGSGKKGASNDLKDLVSNIDAVPGAGENSAFNIAGAIASLPGDGVNIAKQGGGGFLSTLSGDDVAGKDSGIAKLTQKKKPGKVRGKVTKMSSGAKVSGKLSRADVMRVINSHIGQVQACYEKALLSNPSLGGRIVFDWTVTATGKVKGVRVRSSTLGSTKVASCI